ncbi:protein ELC-like [Macadamia integrifolia]|uniref:protein ELC-like n=1 Tax=Macadamia integrifolia TaxID=60698 RepID=UPI001C4E42BD|nr:protein ELC-like [Macadamia integrifolia]
MAPPSSIQFVDAVLSYNNHSALSYTDPDQKLLIRDHLLSLLQEFPCFKPSTDTFIHNDGTTVNLLNASGSLQVSHSSRPVPLTIWLHQNYPFSAPIVLLSLDPSNPILPHHPFVDSSGTIISPYLETWCYPRSSLSEFAHNLTLLLCRHYPFFSPTSSIFSSGTHPSFMSKMEALDRLVATLHQDMAALQTRMEGEIEGLSVLQVEMVKRSDTTTCVLLGLEHESMRLKTIVRETTEKADFLLNWLRANDLNSVHEVEEPFEAADEMSKLVLCHSAEDLSIDDVMYALDKALEEGVVTFREYTKQVRNLAREQFFHRAKVIKIKELRHYT